MLNPTALDEKTLLSQLSDGNEAAFRRLYELHWNKIYSLAIYYFKSPLTAQDIVQETFLKIWIKRKEFGEINNFAAYVHVVARNIIISSLRKKYPFESLELDADRIQSSDSPEHELELKHVATTIQKAIELLPPQQRKVYQLNRESGLPLKQVAETLGISYNTTREHMSRALKSIREYLKDHLGELWAIVVFLMHL